MSENYADWYDRVQAEDKPVQDDPWGNAIAAALGGAAAGAVRGAVTGPTRAAVGSADRAVAQATAKATPKQPLNGNTLGTLSKEEILRHFDESAQRIKAIMKAPEVNANLKGADRIARIQRVSDAVHTARASLPTTPGAAGQVARGAATNVAGKVTVTPTQILPQLEGNPVYQWVKKMAGE